MGMEPGLVAGTASELGMSRMQMLGRYRYRVFVELLGWHLPGASANSEWDQFDTPMTVHVLAMQDSDVIAGCARLLPTTGPYLLESVFPQLLARQGCPCSTDVWELSRFAAPGTRRVECGYHPLVSNAAFALLRFAMAQAQARGARELVTVSPLAVERMLRYGGFSSRRLGPPQHLGRDCLVAFAIRL